MSVLTKVSKQSSTSPQLNRALVVESGGIELRTCEIPPLQTGEVLIQVGAIGLCRTDLAVMSGAMPVRSGLIPGHEFAGTIALTGGGVTGVRPGDNVAVNPVLVCGECQFCRRGTVQYCVATRFLGLDVDGACADFAIVPATAVHTIPQDVLMTVAAFAEPVAASLGVMNSGITPAESGVIIGDNRISRLTQRVLLAHGFKGVEVCPTRDASALPNDAYDFAIETEATADVLMHMLRVIRPRGRMVLKSRPSQPVPLNFRSLLPKEPVLYPVNYGPFDQAVQLLVDQRVRVEDLIGTCWPLNRHVEAIAEAQSGEHQKTFLLPNEA